MESSSAQPALLFSRYMLYTQLDQDPLESFLTRLVNDAVQEASTSVVRETVKEMARDYVEYKQVDEVLDDLLADYLDEIGQELVICHRKITLLKVLSDKP